MIQLDIIMLDRCEIIKNKGIWKSITRYELEIVMGINMKVTLEITIKVKIQIKIKIEIQVKIEI